MRSVSNGTVTHLGIGFVFGAVVTALIYTFGHISGAHFNPAVTLALWISGFFLGKHVIAYVLAQSIGAIATSLLLFISLGNVAQLCVTLPLNDKLM